MKKLFRTLQLSIVAFILAGCSGMHSPQAIHSTPTTTTNAASATMSHPEHIALLLPLSGSLAPYATAIRNGFTVADEEQKSRAGFSPAVTIIDTTGINMHDAYQQAIAQGANMIVGPLNKPDVAALNADSSLTTPVLALNTTPADTHVNDKVYQFGLSPSDEAVQVAIKAFQDHHRSVLILAPSNAWGQRLVNAFSEQWKSMGGSIAATQYYDDMSTLSKKISDVLGINSAYRNDHAVSNILRENVRFIPSRRQDFDSIFMVATPMMAKQIQPLLRFYFVTDIPIYTTSQINSHASKNDADLDGIQFCEMPWILAPNQMPQAARAAQERIQQTWPKNYARLAKFYAMGVDAFMLSTELNAIPTHAPGMPGATGSLYLSSNHHINRTLVWAKFVNGTPQIIN